MLLQYVHNQLLVMSLLVPQPVQLAHQDVLNVTEQHVPLALLDTSMSVEHAQLVQQVLLPVKEELHPMPQLALSPQVHITIQQTLVYKLVLKVTVLLEQLLVLFMPHLQQVLQEHAHKLMETICNFVLLQLLVLLVQI